MREVLRRAPPIVGRARGMGVVDESMWRAQSWDQPGGPYENSARVVR